MVHGPWTIDLFTIDLFAIDHHTKSPSRWHFRFNLHRATFFCPERRSRTSVTTRWHMKHPERSIDVLLARLIKTNAPLAMATMFGCGALFVAFSVYRVGAAASVGLTALGFLSFTLLEYLMHRYLYHLPTPTPARVRLQSILHGLHHDAPRDKRRLAMPPVLALLLAGGFLALFSLAMGQAALAWTGGMVWGYGFYLLVHYVVHTRRPPRNFLRYLWVHHSIHHYKDHDRAFGVSSPLWDYVFGTMPMRDHRESTARMSGPA